MPCAADAFGQVQSEGHFTDFMTPGDYFDATPHALAPGQCLRDPALERSRPRLGRFVRGPGGPVWTVTEGVGSWSPQLSGLTPYYMTYALIPGDNWTQVLRVLHPR